MIGKKISNTAEAGKFKLKAILKLFLSCICIVVFVLFLAPEIDNLEIVKPMVNNIDEKGIDASALFYTDIDEFSAAELRVRTFLNYSHANQTKNLHGTNNN